MDEQCRRYRDKKHDGESVGEAHVFFFLVCVVGRRVLRFFEEVYFFVAVMGCEVVKAANGKGKNAGNE